MTTESPVIAGYDDLAQYLGVDHLTTIYSLVSREPGLQRAKVTLEAKDSGNPLIRFDRATVDAWLQRRKQMQRITKAEIAHLLHRAVELLRRYHQELYQRPLDLLEANLLDVERVKPPPKPQGRAEHRTVPLWVAARTLGVSVPVVRRLADKGVLRFARSPGGHRRVVVEDVIALRAQRRAEKKKTQADELGF